MIRIIFLPNLFPFTFLFSSLLITSPVHPFLFAFHFSSSQCSIFFFLFYSTYFFYNILSHFILFMQFYIFFHSQYVFVHVQVLSAASTAEQAVLCLHERTMGQLPGHPRRSTTRTTRSTRSTGPAPTWAARTIAVARLKSQRPQFIQCISCLSLRFFTSLRWCLSLL